MNRFLSFLGLSFDPDLDGVVRTVQDPEEDSPSRQSAKIPDNVHYVKGTGVAFEVDEESQSWDRWSKDKRTPDLTDRDLDLISKAETWTPKEDKYRTIKGRWALGLSISEASDSLTAELGRGWKVSTVEKYYALINKAAGSSPSGREGGGVPKTTQAETTFFQNVNY